MIAAATMVAVSPRRAVMAEEVEEECFMMVPHLAQRERCVNSNLLPPYRGDRKQG
jgi:hypothetical protein